MSLDPQIISLIRDEIGDDSPDFVDNIVDFDPANNWDSLEAIYTDEDRGNYTILGTAVIVWRRRLANHRLRAYDVSKEGNWYAFSQKTRFLQGMVAKYESLTGQRQQSRNVSVLSEAQSAGLTDE